MSDIFNEIDEDLRRDRAAKLAKTYGPYAIGLAVLVVLAVGGYNYWQAEQVRAREATADAFTAANRVADADPLAAANEMAAVAEVADTGFATLIRLRQSALQAEAGDQTSAIAVLRSLADDGAVDSLYRDLARLKIVLAEFDSADADALRAELEALAAPNAPWRFTATELLAVLALRRGDDLEARTLYQSLVDDLSAPNGLRARAAEVLQTLPKDDETESG